MQVAPKERFDSLPFSLDKVNLITQTPKIPLSLILIPRPRNKEEKHCYESPTKGFVLLYYHGDTGYVSLADKKLMPVPRANGNYKSVDALCQEPVEVFDNYFFDGQPIGFMYRQGDDLRLYTRNELKDSQILYTKFHKAEIGK